MSSDPQIRGGEECLAGTRIPMSQFVADDPAAESKRNAM